MSLRQIGEVLGLREGAVKSRLHRARRMLARELKEMGEPIPQCGEAIP